jgi:hypothetical protein
MKTNFLTIVVGTVLCVGLSSSAFAKPKHPRSPVVNATAPECLDDSGNVLPVDDLQAIHFKTGTPNGATSRAHVSGPITKIYPNASGHDHFEITLSNNPGDTLEVVYNISFGALPTLKVGMTVEACGDFINAYAPENGYQASPDGALIHWIHRTNSAHPAGFTIVNGVLYGQGNGNGS